MYRNMHIAGESTQVRTNRSIRLFDEKARCSNGRLEGGTTLYCIYVGGEQSRGAPPKGFFVMLCVCVCVCVCVVKSS